VDKDFVDMDKDLEEDNGLEIIMADIKWKRCYWCNKWG
jgi:hypothetical protein